MSKGTQFEYAWCLVRSKYNDDIRKGIALLEGEFLGYPTLPFPAAAMASFTPSISSAGFFFFF